MDDFLSTSWFESLNATLRAAGPVPMAPRAAALRVVLEFTGAPASSPHALTLTLSPEEASAAPGDHLGADALVRLSYDDALDLTLGRFDSATALREGRLKIRGDVHALVPLLNWLQRTHPDYQP